MTNMHPISYRVPNGEATRGGEKESLLLLSHEALGESFHFFEAEFSSSFYFSEVSWRLDRLSRKPFL